jgi:hypothetical protein
MMFFNHLKLVERIIVYISFFRFGKFGANIQFTPSVFWAFFRQNSHK